MSARKQIDELNAKVGKLREERDEAREDAKTHLRVIEDMSIKVARADKVAADLAAANEDRAAAWSRVAELMGQLDSVNTEVVTLANKLDAAVAAQGEMPETIAALCKVVAANVATTLLGKAPAPEAHALDLQRAMFDAGCSIDLDVKILIELEGLR